MRIKDKENHRQGKSKKDPGYKASLGHPRRVLGLWMGALRVLRRGSQKKNWRENFWIVFGTFLRCAGEFGVKE
jgi:hypothetical protein